MEVANLESVVVVGVTVAECGGGEDDLVVLSAFGMDEPFCSMGKKGEIRGIVKEVIRRLKSK